MPHPLYEDEGCTTCGCRTIPNSRHLVTRVSDGAYFFTCSRRECLAVAILRLDDEYLVYVGRNVGLVGEIGVLP